MTRAGRPLRFLGLVVAGWVLLRAVALWPAGSAMPDLRDVVRPGIGPMALPQAWGDARDEDGTAPMRRHLSAAIPAAVWRTSTERPRGIERASPHDRHDLTLALAGLVRFGSGGGDAADPPPLGPPVVTPAGQPGASTRPGSRWSASAWYFYRRDGQGGGLDTPQLGGGQAGARLAYLVDRRHRLAVAARVVTPLTGVGREAAVGLDWQPTRAPVRVLVEQRFGLDGQGSGPAALLVGGIGPRPIAGKWTIEAYGQAGAVYRHRVEPFADGAVRVAHPLVRVGPARLDAGVGAWGAAQRGVSRVDIGPTVGATVPFGGRNLRVAVDWRERLAGNATPGSGPAVTAGVDF